MIIQSRKILTSNVPQEYNVHVHVHTYTILIYAL